MTAAVCITVAALIYVCALSPAAALLLGRVIRNRNTQTPAVGAGAGKAPSDRGAHLRVDL